MASMKMEKPLGSAPVQVKKEAAPAKPTATIASMKTEKPLGSVPVQVQKEAAPAKPAASKPAPKASEPKPRNLLKKKVVSTKPAAKN